MTDEVLERRNAPLFTPIDRWGHTPFDRSALSAQSIAGILAAHVSGQAAAHRPYLRRRPRLDDVPEPYQPEVYPEIVLDDRYYERGIEARATQEALSDVADILDDVEDQADAILAKLLAVLDGEF